MTLATIGGSVFFGVKYAESANPHDYSALTEIVSNMESSSDDAARSQFEERRADIASLMGQLTAAGSDKPELREELGQIVDDMGVLRDDYQMLDNPRLYSALMDHFSSSVDSLVPEDMDKFNYGLGLFMSLVGGGLISGVLWYGAKDLDDWGRGY